MKPRSVRLVFGQEVLRTPVSAFPAAPAIVTLIGEDRLLLESKNLFEMVDKDEELRGREGSPNK